MYAAVNTAKFPAKFGGALPPYFLNRGAHAPWPPLFRRPYLAMGDNVFNTHLGTIILPGSGT